ncbi:hypothetical protein NM688_g5743 [Phlebia brevispora]|uniref:Uncharacterized protein n=1 Tax=Phlebia brevispora TaxID=194682 RepID=A0ACC1SR01_9APHY|nr:hypothetical protein NM688_g5743 [Phlebia brevispora]
MIRREPTMIPMTDHDLEDIRQMLQERRNWKQFMRDDDSIERDAVPGFAQQAEAQKKREAMTKNERMGVQ